MATLHWHHAVLLQKTIQPWVRDPTSSLEARDKRVLHRFHRGVAWLIQALDSPIDTKPFLASLAQQAREHFLPAFKGSVFASWLLKLEVVGDTDAALALGQLLLVHGYLEGTKTTTRRFSKSSSFKMVPLKSDCLQAQLETCVAAGWLTLARHWPLTKRVYAVMGHDLVLRLYQSDTTQQHFASHTVAQLAIESRKLRKGPMLLVTTHRGERITLQAPHKPAAAGWLFAFQQHRVQSTRRSSSSIHEDTVFAACDEACGLMTATSATPSLLMSPASSSTSITSTTTEES
eukprot:m.257712 g.257712  ORF g.257712 m.257712 type:complete len:289 (+) comp15533_c0_seq5:447-1313(+)